MPLVEIEINTRLYQLACEPGQEGRLKELAAFVDERLQEVTGGGRSGSEAMMLVATCLVLADALADAQSGRGAARPSPAEEAEAVAAIDAVTRRIEEVALRLERA